jgi:hypothetical protein
MSKPESVSVTIALTEEAGRELDATLARLRKAGLREASVLEAIGVVTGSVARTRLEALRRVKGATVEIEESVPLPPPDSPVQ